MHAPRYNTRQTITRTNYGLSLMPPPTLRQIKLKRNLETDLELEAYMSNPDLGVTAL